jgi:hypothetical protein
MRKNSKLAVTTLTLVHAVGWLPTLYSTSAPPKGSPGGTMKVTLPGVDVTTSALKGILEPEGRIETVTGNWGKIEKFELIVRMNPVPELE